MRHLKSFVLPIKHCAISFIRIIMPAALQRPRLFSSSARLIGCCQTRTRAATTINGLLVSRARARSMNLPGARIRSGASLTAGVKKTVPDPVQILSAKVCNGTTPRAAWYFGYRCCWLGQCWDCCSILKLQPAMRNCRLSNLPFGLRGSGAFTNIIFSGTL